MASEVVIPHHNRLTSLRRVLTALREQSLGSAVCVVDNGSTDLTPEVVPGEFPEVRYVRLESNRGFSAAVNLGVRSSEADFIVLLNNDAVPDRRFVEGLLEAQQAAQAEMVAGCLRAPDGSIDSLGIEIDQSLVAYDRLRGRPFSDGDRAEPEPLAPTGGAAGFERALLERVGGFDEAMFAYLEDVELGIRCRLAGAGCVAAPQAFAWHERSRTLPRGSSAKNALMGANRGHLLWKHGANLTRHERARGAVIDGLVYGAQIVVDRNAGAIRARARERRRRPVPPGPAPNFRLVPRRRLSVRMALRRRLASRVA